MGAVFRMQGFKRKSIERLSKAMDIRQYEKIAIVDDKLYDPEVWDLRRDDEIILRGYEIPRWSFGITDNETVNWDVDAHGIREVLFDGITEEINACNDNELLCGDCCLTMHVLVY